MKAENLFYCLFFFVNSEILQSELICGSEDLNSGGVFPNSAGNIDSQSEALLKFLSSMEEEKQKRASKLSEDIRCLEEDISTVERRYLSRTSSDFSRGKEFSHVKEEEFSSEESNLMSKKNEDTLMKNITQLENAYFYMRSQIQHKTTAVTSQSDKELQKKKEKKCHVKIRNEDSSLNQASDDCIGAFFDGLCKFARYSKFKVCGTLKNGDFFNSTSAICSLSFDRDEDYIAAAKVSKKIKIFEFAALANDETDIHYPVVELLNKSMLSCVCWNYYIKNYLASTDYDGVVKVCFCD